MKPDTNGSCARRAHRFSLALVPDAIVEISLVCIECELIARGDDAAGWRAYLTCDEPPEVGIYCRTALTARFERD